MLQYVGYLLLVNLVFVLSHCMPSDQPGGKISTAILMEEFECSVCIRSFGIKIACIPDALSDVDVDCL